MNCFSQVKWRKKDEHEIIFGMLFEFKSKKYIYMQMKVIIYIYIFQRKWEFMLD